MDKYSPYPGDKVPAMLEEGEYVLNRNAVKALGKKKLDIINKLQHPRYPLKQVGSQQIAQMAHDNINKLAFAEKIEHGNAFDRTLFMQTGGQALPYDPSTLKTVSVTDKDQDPGQVIPGTQKVVQEPENIDLRGQEDALGFGGDPEPENIDLRGKEDEQGFGENPEADFQDALWGDDMGEFEKQLDKLPEEVDLRGQEDKLGFGDDEDIALDAEAEEMERTMWDEYAPKEEEKKPEVAKEEVKEEPKESEKIIAEAKGEAPEEAKDSKGWMSKAWDKVKAFEKKSSDYHQKKWDEQDARDKKFGEDAKAWMKQRGEDWKAGKEGFKGPDFDKVLSGEAEGTGAQKWGKAAMMGSEIFKDLAALQGFGKGGDYAKFKKQKQLEAVKAKSDKPNVEEKSEVPTTKPTAAEIAEKAKINEVGAENYDDAITKAKLMEEAGIKVPSTLTEAVEDQDLNFIGPRLPGGITGMGNQRGGYISLHGWIAQSLRNM